MPFKDKKKQALYQRNWRLDRMMINQTFLWDLKTKTPCADCGKNFHPVAMDFDHIKGTKIEGISELATWGQPLALIKKEIAKCEIVCAVCHRIRTYNRLPIPLSSSLVGR